MIRRVHAGLLTLLAVLALSVPLYAAETITHQGRLLGTDDKPVADGSYGATFSLWDDPVAGVQVWSEFRDIQTKSGLFSVELGQVSSFFDIFTEFADRDLYLQTQVQISGATETLSPRLRIGTVPTASVARRVHAIHNGSSLRALCDVGTADTGAVATFSVDSDGDGVPDRSIDQDCDGVSASFRMRKRPEILYQAWDDGIAMHIDDLSSSSAVTHDLDGDGVLDMVISSVCDATGSRLAIGTKGTSAKRTVACSTSESSASVHLDADDDGDGIPERGIDDDCDGVSASRRLSVSNLGSSGQDGVNVRLRCDLDSAVGSTELRKNGALISADYDRHTPFHNSHISSFFDVFTELSIADSIDATGAVRRLSTHNLGSSGQDGVEIAARPGVGSGIRCDTDSDGDGVPEGVASLGLTPTTSSMAIKTKGTGAAHNRSVTVSSITDESSAVHRCEIDDDGDMVPEQEIEQLLTPTTSSVAIKTKGTGAANNRSSIISTTGLDSATVVSSHDSDGDGFEDAVVSTSAGVGEVGGIPGGVIAARVAIKTKGTGADPNRSSVSSSSSPSSSSVVCAQDSDGDGLADRSVTMDCDDTDGGITVEGAASKVKIRHKGWDGLIYGRMAIENGGAIQVDFGGNGVGFVSERFGVGVLSPTYPIEHSSGAHLTPGGVWTNASDVNLKENFKSVDGEEILDKIEKLEISQWNYKNESDEVTHIGPTAQDFKAAFGVGDNDKSISTIDPSGIALVAVKELRKENQELKSQVAELKKMVEELAKKK
jgi:hypothetical protein